MSKKQNIFHQFVNHLDKKGHSYAADFFYGLFFNKITILKGFIAMLRLAPGMIVGKKKHFNFYGLNPIVITAEQAQHRPLLLIHGNYTNQSNWLNWARRLHKDYPGPVFTVNLPNGHWSSKDSEIIDSKLSEIKSLYAQRDVHNVKTHFVGHSRGGTMAYFNSLQQDQWFFDDKVKGYENLSYRNEGDRSTLKFREDVDQVILLGSISFKKNTFTQVSNKLHAIQSTNDFFFAREKEIHQKVAENPDDVLVTKSTHCSLIQDNNVYQQVLKWINDADPNKAIESNQKETAIPQIK